MSNENQGLSVAVKFITELKSAEGNPINFYSDCDALTMYCETCGLCKKSEKTGLYNLSQCKIMKKYETHNYANGLNVCGLKTEPTYSILKNHAGERIRNSINFDYGKLPKEVNVLAPNSNATLLFGYFYGQLIRKQRKQK